ncbi:hypothetical protein [Salmonella enterica]|uniref:hypothetical protein n=1 Tax=Salmonella enterica TaxID=28901 RepID=UPI001CF7B8E7|nr:hypothetical protein [Salmonella enterica]
MRQKAASSLTLQQCPGKRYGSVTICTAAAAGSMPTVGFRRVSNILSPRAFTRPISSACAPASSPVVSVSRKTGPSANQVCASMANLPRSLFIRACRPRRVLASRCFSV